MLWNANDRRRFFHSMLGLPGLGVLAAGSLQAAQGSKPAAPVRDVLDELRVRTFINAAGTYTRLTASLMPSEVVAAIRAASTKFVPLDELHEKAGAYLAKRLECEAVLVTAGCASALTMGTAASIAGDDAAMIKRLPDTAGMKSEVIIQKSHRNGYDHAIRNTGAKLIEVETAQELDAAIGANTAMLFYLNHAANDGQIGHEEFVKIGKKHSVPTMIDAAADVPPVENLFRFTKLGYDLVTISGGKGLRGPQSTGLLLGRKDLIAAATKNNSPNSDSVGRTNKVNKEEIVGLVTAVDLFLDRDHEAVWNAWESSCSRIAKMVGSLDGVETEMFVPEIANVVPHLRIRWDFEKTSFSPKQAAEQLRQGEPSIEVRPQFDLGLEIAVWMLQPNEDRIVARRTREVLAQAIRTI